MTMLQEPKLTERDFKSFKGLIYQLAGIALADSKQIMVQGRLAKRLRALDMDSYSDYWDLISSKSDPDEVTRFVNALTTNKTDFYREKHHFDFLQSTVFPKLKEKAERGGPQKLRIWCSASSTGEEPYTIAMSVCEFFGANSNWDIRILASDIDTDVLNTASQGIYTADRVADVPQRLLQQYFTRESRSPESSVQAKPIIRDLITFRQINLQNSEWPINTVFDVIFCRNVMIYFDAPSQTKIVNHFAEKLSDDGYLIIGHSESLFGLTDLYKPLGETIYGRNLSVPLARSASRTGSLLRGTPSLSHSSVTTAKSPLSRSSVEPSKESTKDSSSRLSALRASSTAAPQVSSAPSDNDPKHRIIVGEVHASNEPIWISTLLGSCVATCLYDDVAKVGGMNHFMLPDSSTNPTACASFGVHAMELLINSIMKKGGKRNRLQAKLFGGGKVVQTSNERWNIGAKNIDFAESFLETEGIPIVASHTGGETGMHVQFNTMTAKVIVRLLDSKKTQEVDREQRIIAARATKSQFEHEDITLF